MADEAKKLKTYEVVVRRKIQLTAVVEVQAEDEELAYEAALDKANGMPYDHKDWEEDDCQDDVDDAHCDDEEE